MRAGRRTLLLAAMMGMAPAARAQLLPGYGAGTNMGTGDLRTRIERSFDRNLGGGPAILGRDWTLTPSLDITQTYDSAQPADGAFRKDYITRLSPGLDGAIRTRRIEGTLDYHPGYDLHALNPRLDGLTHTLEAGGTVTAAEDLLFLNLRGHADTQPILGGPALPGAAGLGSGQAQTVSLAATPYLLHHFGDAATLRLAYTIAHGAAEALQSGAPPGSDSHYESHRESAALASGPDFGRVQATLRAEAVQYAGTGAYRGAHRETATLGLDYALTRTVTLQSTLGHENIHYGPASYGLGSPGSITGITWSLGARLAPNAQSTVTASYGHREGADSFAFDGVYAASPRLHLLARYAEGVGTALERLQDRLATTIAAPGGDTLDKATGAPVAMDDFLGLQQGVYRTATASAGALLLQARDSFLLSVERGERRLLGQPVPGVTPGTSRGLGANLAWQHDLSADLTATAFVQYGVRDVPGAGSSRTVQGGVRLGYRLSETLASSLTFSHAQTSGAALGLPPVRDLAVAGLRKSF